MFKLNILSKRCKYIGETPFWRNTFSSCKYNECTMKLPKLGPCPSSTTYRNIFAHSQTLSVGDDTNNTNPNEKSYCRRPQAAGCTRDNIQIDAFCWIEHWYFFLCLGTVLFWWEGRIRLLYLFCRSCWHWLCGVYCCVKTVVQSGVTFGDGDVSWLLRGCYLSRSPRVSCFH